MRQNLRCRILVEREQARSIVGYRFANEGNELLSNRLAVSRRDQCRDFRVPFRRIEYEMRAHISAGRAQLWRRTDRE